MPINFGAALGSGLQAASDTNQQINAQRLKEKALAKAQDDADRRYALDREKFDYAKQPKPISVGDQIALEKLEMERTEHYMAARGGSFPIPGGSQIPGVVRQDTWATRMADPEERARIESTSLLDPGYGDQLQEMDRERDQREVIDQELRRIMSRGGDFEKAGVWEDDEDREAFAFALQRVGGQDDTASLWARMEEAEQEYLGRMAIEDTKKELGPKMKDLLANSDATGAEREALVRMGYNALHKPGATAEDMRIGFAETHIESDKYMQAVIQNKFQEYELTRELARAQRGAPQVEPTVDPPKSRTVKAMVDDVGQLDQEAAQGLLGAIIEADKEGGEDAANKVLAQVGLEMGDEVVKAISDAASGVKSKLSGAEKKKALQEFRKSGIGRKHAPFVDGSTQDLDAPPSVREKRKQRYEKRRSQVAEIVDTWTVPSTEPVEWSKTRVREELLPTVRWISKLGSYEKRRKAFAEVDKPTGLYWNKDLPDIIEEILNDQSPWHRSKQP